MKNLLSREEFLQKQNEGFVGNVIKKGVNKIKSLFKIGMKKIKNFIAIFDKDGNVLPVVSPQCVLDVFSDGDSIKAYASKGMNTSIESAGGNKCQESAPMKETDEIYDWGPDGKEFSEWLENGDYKESNEYKNFMSLPSIINECYDSMTDDMKKLFESWEDVKKDRVNYKKGGELREIPTIDVDKFTEIIDDMIFDRIFDDDYEDEEKYSNILVFGAPGIGKSTIPNQVIKKYNDNAKSDAERMALITVDCPNIAVGDFMMPTMPNVRDVQGIIKENPEAFPKSAEYLKNMTPEQSEKIEKSLSKTKQFEAGEAPKSWLPSYRKTGDSAVDTILNDYANGGVYEDEKSKTTHKTGNGGIIMFDEFLRTDPNVFKQLMIFLLTRELNGWKLGDKWVIIACSNRPCDDQEVEETWGQWNQLAAAKDRFERMFHLEPNPEQWKNWISKKGCDKLILDYIFEEKSKSGDEYPRWHSMVRGGTDGEQVKVISPRNWVRAINGINKYERRHKVSDISKISDDDLRTILEGYFDVSFVSDFVDWIGDHKASVDLESIMKNPQKVKLSSRFNGKDEAQSVILIRDLWEQFEEKFKDNVDECTDEMFSNIVLWLGINYKGAYNSVNTEFFDKIPELLGDKLLGFYKSMNMIAAAFPDKSIISEMEEFGNSSSIKDIKDLMREYFPWRLDDDDEINYIDDIKTDMD